MENRAVRAGFLVYDRADIEKNRSSISMFTDYARDIGIELKLVTAQELTDVRDREDPGTGIRSVMTPVNGEQPVVINRSRNLELAAEFEKFTPYVFNSSEVTLYGNDKYAADQFLKEKGIKTIQTYSADEIDSIGGYPAVAKTRNGHGGAQVYLINSRSEADRLRSEHGENIIFQDYIKSGSSDLRVYVVGGRILCGMLRTSERDFRSNFSLGGRAEQIEVPEKVRFQTEQICGMIRGAAYCGIDFLRTEDGWIFNEIEDVVGARMVYANTGLDPIREFVEYIGTVIGV